MKDTEKEVETGRGRSRLLAGSPMWDHSLSQRLGHSGVPFRVQFEEGGCRLEWVCLVCEELFLRLTEGFVPEC